MGEGKLAGRPYSNPEHTSSLTETAQREYCHNTGMSVNCLTSKHCCGRHKVNKAMINKTFKSQMKVNQLFEALLYLTQCGAFVTI